MIDAEKPAPDPDGYDDEGDVICPWCRMVFQGSHDTYLKHEDLSCDDCGKPFCVWTETITFYTTRRILK